MVDLLDTIKDYAVAKYEKEGVRVYLKTDVSPEVEIYNSDTKTETSNTGKPSLIKYQIRVTNRNGNELINYGEAKTNLFKVAVVGAVGVASLFVIVKGLKGSYVQLKKSI